MRAVGGQSPDQGFLSFKVEVFQFKTKIRIRIRGSVCWKQSRDGGAHGKPKWNRKNSSENQVGPYAQEWRVWRDSKRRIMCESFGSDGDFFFQLSGIPRFLARSIMNSTTGSYFELEGSLRKLQSTVVSGAMLPGEYTGSLRGSHCISFERFSIHSLCGRWRTKAKGTRMDFDSHTNGKGKDERSLVGEINQFLFSVSIIV